MRVLCMKNRTKWFDIRACSRFEALLIKYWALTQRMKSLCKRNVEPKQEVTSFSLVCSPVNSGTNGRTVEKEKSLPSDSITSWSSYSSQVASCGHLVYTIRAVRGEKLSISSQSLDVTSGLGVVKELDKEALIWRWHEIHPKTKSELLVSCGARYLCRQNARLRSYLKPSVR